MDAKVGAVGPEFLGGDGEVDRLQQGVRRRAGRRLRRRRPVSEREEADCFHETSLPGLPRRRDPDPPVTRPPQAEPVEGPERERFFASSARRGAA